MTIQGVEDTISEKLLRIDMQQEEKPLTVEEVASLLRVKIETVRIWIRSGELNAVDVGKYIIYPSDLEAFKLKRSTKTRRKKTD